jgi:small nuclear ribonucleoprotein (snRNP)-like protein
MSVTGTHGVGLPIILLHDAEGAVVTVELKDGSLYRGILDEAQDNMNCTIKVNFKLKYIKKTRLIITLLRIVSKQVHLAKKRE